MTYISTAMAPGWNEVIVWERNQKTGKRETKRYPAPYYFFVQDEEGEYQDIYGNRLCKLEFDDNKSFREAVERFTDLGERLYESDISPQYKVLSSHYYGKEVGKLNITFFDIEVDYDKSEGFAGPENPYAPVNAVSIYHTHLDKMIVIAVPPDKSWTIDKLPEDMRELAEIEFVKNERELLLRFFEEIDDSDIISGWNSEGYDVPYIYERAKAVLGQNVANKLSFDDARPPVYTEFEDKYGSIRQRLDIFGRVHVDYMQLFFKFEPGERDSFSLGAIAEEELDGMEKLEYEGSLADLYRNDFPFFIRYNIRDCEILKGLEELKGYMTTAIMLSHMDAAQIIDVLGTIKLTECAITNYCHHTLNCRVPDTNRNINASGEKFGGAYVIDPQVGLHDWVASIDVTSLYPSAMRTVNISPDVLVGQFSNYDSDFRKLKNRENAEITALFGDDIAVTKSVEDWIQWLKDKKYSVSGFGTIFDQNKQGMIPALLTQWFNLRKEYKAKAAEAKKKFKELKEAGKPYKEIEDQYKYYDKLQNIFKLKLNSTYGACGNKFFKFYDLRLAESTTKTGQQILFHMASMIGKLLIGEYKFPNKAVIYGDTDSCYFKTYGETLEEAFEVATIIAKRINQSFHEFCAETFLVNENFNGLVKVAQEVVASKSVFIDGKKNYIMRVLKKDGIDVDEIKITGLQIKKTNIPKLVREALTNYFAKFLRGAEWKEVGVEILEFKEKLLKNGDLSLLGKQTRVSNLEHYVEVLNAKTPGVTIPGHVMASILWNECLTQYGDKVSLKIVSGMKVRVFSLKKKVSVFRSIAMPVDLDIIPDWFIEHFIPRLDLETQVNKVVDKPLESLLFAIKERIPTRKDLLIDELFE